MASPADPRRTLSQASPQRSSDAASPAARLTAVHPPELDWRLELDERAAVLGRDGAPPLDNRTVSRRHVEVRWDSGGHVAAELGSRNGARVDGGRLDDRAQPLADGAVLQLGDVFLVYERGAPDDDDAGGADNVPGRSAAARRLRAAVARAAADPSPVLLLGETGTGKEWIARELHGASGRRGDQVAVNCAAIGAHLVESQLFGHVKGAFTGATAEQRGLLHAADRGTLFLDEIGELPLELQPKLLRVLQDRQVTPVGGTRATTVDVRIVAATNRDLHAAVAAGGFRRDLYARLALWEIAVPPLRARRVDVLAWLTRLYEVWRKARPGTRAAPLALLPDAVETLLLFPWPDNLRGLDRLVHLLAAAPPRAAIARADLPAWVREDQPPATAAARAPRQTPTREEVERVHADLGGNVRAMARHFDRDRRQIYRWLTAFGLKRGDGDPGDDAP